MELIPSEHVEQREFVRWFRQTYRGVKIIAIPNGEHRSKTAALRLKAEGVTPGVPDLFVPAWRLWIEMKRRKGGRISAEQREMIDYLRDCGYSCVVARGADEARVEVEAARVEIEAFIKTSN
jgi:rhodanese-related sulfurtransferase